MSLDELAARVHERLEALVPARDVRLRRATLNQLSARVVVVTDGLVQSDAALSTALLRVAAEALTHHEELEARRAQIESAVEAVDDEGARRRLVSEHLSGLVVDPVQLVGDLAATRRWMDHEAIFDRLAVLEADQIDIVELAYRAATAIAEGIDASLMESLDPTALIGLATNTAQRSRNEAVRVEALRFVGALLRRYASTERLMVLGVHRFRPIVEWARDVRLECWIRVRALEVAVSTVSREALELLSEQLQLREARDGMVVRNNALRLLADLPTSAAERLRVARLAQDDPSEHVRQGLASALARIGGRRSLRAMVGLVLDDSSPRVRAFALRELANAATDDVEALRAFIESLSTILSRARRVPSGASRLVLLVGCAEVRRLGCGDDAVLPADELLDLLVALMKAGTLGTDILEEIGATVRALDVHSRRELDEVRRVFADELRHLGEGAHTVVEVRPEVPLVDVEKALSVAVRGDLACSCEPLGRGRFRLTRGEPRRVRAWRLFHELTSPAPDKRQAFTHTHARFDHAHIVVPPYQMGEVTPTPVPGERRMIGSLRGWGVFLPRVDDLLATAMRGRSERRVVTSFGTVVLRGPKGWWRRLWARAVLSFRYASFARTRESALRSTEQTTMQSYAARASRLGIGMTIEETRGAVGGRQYDVASPAVSRYLGASIFAQPAWIEPVVDAVLRPGGSTAWHMALVVWFALSFMVIRSAWQRSRIERARRVIPLTIGGWGSRGKSGTERIKAALFHALRYDVVVKTTGCEAMFIHARRDQPARELFVYRPYGKATIWEQDKVLSYADRLHAQVFLWECMALRPQFVKILETEWMRDDITTLTNAYPDHEDVMGPSGEDVARVIGAFMPRQGVVFTAEQEMLPLLAESARQVESELVAVSDIDAQLLPEDLLARYPYAEHPRNIALIVALAQHLGVDREWALVKMADYVVPDLGVLKTYPTVSYLERELTFSNGMSANERAGFLSNWARLGFDGLDVDDHPNTVMVAVVNNRADRVPRSRVFAELLTRDVTCDRIVLIGTNLNGMRGFLQDSLDSWLETLELGGETEEQALENLAALVRRQRMVAQRSTLRARLVAMLRAAKHADCEGTADRLLPSTETEQVAVQMSDLALVEASEVSREDLALHLERALAEYRMAAEAESAIRAALRADDRARANQRLRDWFRRAALLRISLVVDSHASGDRVIHHVAREVPPGHHARILGCQNIKGTGLDFAYRWVSVGQVAAALDRLESDPETRPDTLRWLASHGDYGLVDTLLAKRTLERLMGEAGGEWETWRGTLRALTQQFGAQAEKKRAQLVGAPRRSWVSRVFDFVEPLLDHLDSVRRQNRARRVMQDLYSMRVSQARAAVLLREVTDRGKGGWLARDWETWLRKRRSQVS